MLKNIFVAVILIALGAVGATVFINKDKDKEPAESTSTSKVESYKWTFEEKGQEKGTGAPLTEVSLSYGGSTKVIGTYQGSCSVIDNKAWTLLSGEKSGVICWFAGGGSEIGVFEEGGKLVVKEGFVEEGDAETSGSRGGFKSVFSL